MRGDTRKSAPAPGCTANAVLSNVSTVGPTSTCANPRTRPSPSGVHRTPPRNDTALNKPISAVTPNPPPARLLVSTAMPDWDPLILVAFNRGPLPDACPPETPSVHFGTG